MIGIRRSFIICCAIILTSCASKSDHKDTFDVAALNTVEKRINFLDSILAIDQQVRAGVNQAQQKFGYQSEEHLKAQQRMNEVDLSNLQVIHQYLKNYDYPTEEEYGYEAYTAPWMVIHHAPNGYDVDYRDLNMPFLLKAWKEGKLKDKAFSFFLNRTYNFRFGESFTFEGSMKTSAEIDTLLTKLNYK